MDKDKTIKELVQKWLSIAERDIVAAQQGINADVVLTDVICFHFQQ